MSFPYDKYPAAIFRV